MDTKKFRKTIDEIAVNNGFERLFGAWFKESDECVIALILRKSNFSRFYYLRIKINLRYAFDQTYNKNKEWVKHDVSHVLLGIDKAYDSYFDLDSPIEDSTREEKLKEVFLHEVIPLIDAALSRNGLLELYKEEKIILLPAVKEELESNYKKQ